MGNVQRLSGSFEYPNTAAAFFAMSLPLVWMVPCRALVRVGGSIVVWIGLILTYSRGAFLAVVVAYFGFWILSRKFAKQDVRRVLAFASIAVVVFLTISRSEPLLVARLSTPSSENPIAAEYGLNYNTLRQRPNVVDETRVTLRNVGVAVWYSAGRERMVLSYRWFDRERRQLLDDAPMETPIPHDVGNDETFTIDARFRTPDNPGSYLLIWDMKSNQDWFSRMGVIPGMIEVEIDPNAVRSTGQADLGRWYRPDPDTIPTLDSSVSRSQFWKAAGQMMLDNPLFGGWPR